MGKSTPFSSTMFVPWRKTMIFTITDERIPRQPQEKSGLGGLGTAQSPN